jgi:hypothetical protein
MGVFAQCKDRFCEDAEIFMAMPEVSTMESQWLI